MGCVMASGGLTHSHRVDDFLNEDGRVAADDAAAEDLSRLPMRQHVDEAVPVLDGGAMRGVIGLVDTGDER